MVRVTGGAIQKYRKLLLIFLYFNIVSFRSFVYMTSFNSKVRETA